MLARANRLRSGKDFRQIMRSGKRSKSQHLVGFLAIGSEPTRFGFVVSRACGGAVQRNQIKRRLRSLARENMSRIPAGSQIVLRSLPGSAELSFPSLSAEFEAVLGLK